MKVHMHTKFCIICLLTFIFHQCNHCHEDGHDHGPEEERVHYHNYYQISEAPYHQNAGTESMPSKFSALEAENEQKYYIEKIFDRFGENGRLSFFGLEKLLISLGLGEVRVVVINHDDIGHDHVSHLYALDVQEGKHFHSHNHPHSHSDSENQTTVGMAAKRNHKCDHERDAALSSIKGDGKHIHDQSHHHHHHHPHLHHHLDHNGTHHSRNDSVGHSEHGEQNHGPSTETNTTQDQRERKQRKQKKKRKKISETSGDTTQDYAPDHHPGDQYEHNRVHKHDHVHDASHMHVHHHEHSSDHSTSHGHQDSSLGNEDGHHHTSKREAPRKQMSVRKHTTFSARSHKDHNEDERDREECLNVTQLLRHYGLETSSPISPELFTYMCPALLYQIERRLCIVHYDELEDFMKSKTASIENKDKTGASAWFCGIISITVISLLSLLGVILIPIINQWCFKFLLTFLVALAVGTMSGDALLHLLPHSHGGHNHSHHHGQGHVHEHRHSHRHAHAHGIGTEGFLEENDPVLKGLVALGGIYVLFIIEHCIRMYKHYNKQKSQQKWCKKKQTEESPIGRKLSDHKLNNRPDADWLQLKPLAGADDSVLSEDRLNETELTDLDGQLESPPKNFLSVEEENNVHHPHNDVLHAAQEHDAHDSEYDSHGEDKMIARKHSHHWHHKHSHHSHGHCHSGKDLKDTGIANIAWMVIMGDGIHNFSDGLAIGAAFSAGLTGGISTSIAVFCHELPHELGDFAVLLKAGMTVKQAIVYNLLSAMMAYIGMLIGTAVGQYANNITLWIFAVTAGMFLYVALVDMLPEMLHGDGDNEEHGYCPVGQFILQNLGLLLGFAIMLVIALYEDKIVLDIQF
ncbi:zinc transporter ZIP10 isoform X1 [Oxyura jamaicensis]|nr:zinc transporter ZIP10 isoform X1 [Oxyura jamaicensis]XP_035188144.1 zinc transporter ZIP10 isoform X1 [Oxyura jamaicensis]XP_035188147.1 zinc transporter ZIP10 isoform X1 [Oxyura jamaicensis]XP_035188148.1 zinc transporter ZIP10 isoform X1 [Oxyura jamaicensis]XP_035188149.1 zinc transporter ZIP10 isoform X1 [Oxyura jamaicensis]